MFCNKKSICACIVIDRHMQGFRLEVIMGQEKALWYLWDDTQIIHVMFFFLLQQCQTQSKYIKRYNVILHYITSQVSCTMLILLDQHLKAMFKVKRKRLIRKNICILIFHVYEEIGCRYLITFVWICALVK